jgi:hypothetical protein
MPRVVWFDCSASSVSDPFVRALDEESRKSLLAFVESATARDCLTLLTLAERPALMRAVEIMIDELQDGLK